MRRGRQTFQDLTGQAFGRLIVERYSHTDRWRGTHWRCRCTCGGYCVTRAQDLKRQTRGTRSCGCLHSEASAITIQAYNNKIRAELIRALFTDGLFPLGPPKQ